MLSPCPMCVCVKLLSRVRLFTTLWTVAHQASLSIGFSRQEYWSGLPFPSSRNLPNPWIEPRSRALQADSLLSEPPGKPTQGHSAFFIWSNYLKKFLCIQDSHFFPLSSYSATAVFKLIFNSQAVAAAAKSLQSCPTLCNPIDGSPRGSPVPGILQARTLEWVAISFSKA